MKPRRHLNPAGGRAAVESHRDRTFVKAPVAEQTRAIRRHHAGVVRSQIGLGPGHVPYAQIIDQALELLRCRKLPTAEAQLALITVAGGNCAGLVTRIIPIDNRMIKGRTTLGRDRAIVTGRETLAVATSWIEDTRGPLNTGVGGFTSLTGPSPDNAARRKARPARQAIVTRRGKVVAGLAQLCGDA